MRTSHPIQKQIPRTMIDLVLNRPSLKRISNHRHHLRSTRKRPSNSQPRSPLNIPRQIRNGHTPFPRFLLTAGFHNHRVAKNEDPVTRTSLRMPADIKSEHLRRNPDLRRSQPNAPRRNPHRGNQISRQRNHRRIQRIDLRPLGRQHRMRSTNNFLHFARNPQQLRGPVGDGHSSSLSAGLRVTPTPSSSAVISSARWSVPRSALAGISTSAVST